MSFRNLDGSNDWLFGGSMSNYATEANEIALNVQTRILSFYNDCFFDTEAGIDYFNLLDYNRQRELENAIQQVIITTPGVTGCNKINLYINSNRKMTINYDISTIYSTSYTADTQIDNINVV